MELKPFFVNRVKTFPKIIRLRVRTRGVTMTTCKLWGGVAHSRVCCLFICNLVAARKIRSKQDLFSWYCNTDSAAQKQSYNKYSNYPPFNRRWGWVWIFASGTECFSSILLVFSCSSPRIWSKALRTTRKSRSTRLQDVGEEREEENVEAVALQQGWGDFPCGEDDALPEERDLQVPHRGGSARVHGSCHRVPRR